MQASTQARAAILYCCVMAAFPIRRIPTTPIIRPAMPATRPALVVFADPHIKIGLQLVNGTVHLFVERDAMKLIEHGLVEALARALRLGARVIDVLDREIELILVPLWIAAVL